MLQDFCCLRSSIIEIYLLCISKSVWARILFFHIYYENDVHYRFDRIQCKRKGKSDIWSNSCTLKCIIHTYALLFQYILFFSEYFSVRLQPDSNVKNLINMKMVILIIHTEKTLLQLAVIIDFKFYHCSV